MFTKRLASLATITSAFTLLLTALCLPAASAASVISSGSGNGYKISPVRSDLTINPGDSHTLQVYVQNVSNAVENLQVIVNDFVANPDESGNPALLLNGQAAPSHGLKQYVSVQDPKFTLQPGQQKTITATIAIPSRATAGGYFGAIRVAPSSVNAENNVTLAASVASLVLVKVPGDIHEQVGIESLNVQSGGKDRSVLTSGKNLSASVRFKNFGDVQEQPFGKLLLKKNGKQIKTYEVNNTDPRGNVLPGSIRKFSVPLGNVGSFGKYTLQGNFGYGANGQLLTASATFYIIPVGIIVLIIVLLTLIIFLIFELPRIIKRYNRRVLRRGRP